MMEPAVDIESPQGVTTELLSTAVVIVARPELGIRYVNAAAEELLGVSRRRIQGLPLAEVLTLNADWSRRLATAGEQGDGFTGREIAVGIGAERRFVDIVANPSRQDDGEEVLVIELMAIDRHRRIAREEALRAQERANRLLLRGLAHEIRNPLAGLRGAAQLLEREIKATHLRDHTRVIVHEADRLRALVERMIGPAEPLQRTALNIHEVTERVASLLKAEAAADVVIDTRYDPSIPTLSADQDRLIQAILNLGRNALQAIGGEGRVTLATRTLRQFTIGAVRHRLVAAVEVIDTGPGIADDAVEALFQPMVSGRPDGSGLGLTIAQKLISQHGGLIECESEPGHTVFRVILPLTDEEIRDG